MERRELLKMIAAATGAAMIGMPAFGYAQSPVAGAANAFSEADVALLDEVADTILPRTSTPGAKDASAGAFMARYVADCYTPQNQAIFRDGLADLDRRGGQGFLSLSRDARTTLLRALDAEARAGLGTTTAKEGGVNPGPLTPHYFTMLKQLAIFSFFTSRPGATEALRYVPVPGRYDGELGYTPGTPAWATE
jgi:hypothetical protein